MPISFLSPYLKQKSPFDGMFQKIVDSYKIAFIGLRKEVWLLSLVVLINRCGTMAIPFMSIYITQGLGRSIADAGWVISLFGIGAVLGTQTGGFLTDRLGFRTVQIGTTIMAGLTFIAFSFVKDFKLLCILTVVLGFFAEAFKPANFTAIATYAKPENLTRSYSLNRLAINIGFSLGATMGGVLAAIKYELLFWVEGGVYILVAILILVLLPSRKQAHKELRAARAGLKISSPWKDVYFMKFMLFVTIYTTCFLMMFRLVPVFWKEDWHINEAMIGILMGLNGILISLFEMVLVNYMEAKKLQYRFVLYGILITAFGYSFFLINIGLHVVIAILAVVFFTIGEMFTFPYINTLTSLRSNEYNRGQYAAVYSFTWSFAQVVGPAGGAYLVSKSSYPWLWLALILLCLIAFWGFRNFSKSNQSQG